MMSVPPRMCRLPHHGERGWSEPVDLKIGGLIDPGHVVGEDGHRYLFLSGINRVRLTDDGLATAGPVEKVYDGWHYPDDWVTEGYSLESTKLFRCGDYFYLVSAVGGTSGPPTGHMVIVARSRSINGPWIDCPHNPIVRTRSAHGIILSDDFAKPAFGTRWTFCGGVPDEARRAHFHDGALELAAKGNTPADSPPLSETHL